VIFVLLFRLGWTALESWFVTSLKPIGFLVVSEDEIQAKSALVANKKRDTTEWV
jgi:hypothetical protein